MLKINTKTNRFLVLLVIIIISCKNKTEKKLTDYTNEIPTTNKSSFDISKGMKELADFLKTSCNNEINYSGIVKCRFIIENECNIEKIKIDSNPYKIEIEQKIENELNKLSYLKKIECKTYGIYMLPLIKFD